MWTSSFEYLGYPRRISNVQLAAGATHNDHNTGRNASRCLALQSTNTASAVRLLGKEGGCGAQRGRQTSPYNTDAAAVVTRLEGSPSEELGEHLQGERWLVLGHLQQERHSGW